MRVLCGGVRVRAAVCAVRVSVAVRAAMAAHVRWPSDIKEWEEATAGIIFIAGFAFIPNQTWSLQWS